MVKCKKYVFLTDCAHAKGYDIKSMVDMSSPITYRTMLRNCKEIFYWGDTVGYKRRQDQGLHIKDDFNLEFYKSFFRGMRCFYLVHRRIEYIWVHEDDLEDFRRYLQCK